MKLLASFLIADACVGYRATHDMICMTESRRWFVSKDITVSVSRKMAAAFPKESEIGEQLASSRCGGCSLSHLGESSITAAIDRAQLDAN